ncbi:MAG: N-acetylmuramoyl-L-alanine amidase [Candidatus Omnitrophica bacterium]|nr:N-acetylmuramoyl-L-alanine amidase [Candidatus Omnitrophota bacterium]MBU1871362.1 N-acetylmuramoyl-L-alanine amidase [Candidatus Omnitrophota bacterium]
MSTEKIIKLFILGLAVIALSSCASLPAVIEPPQVIAPLPPAPVLRQDIVHIVAPGETLWRISKSYGVEIDEIMRANKLREKDKLEMGEKLLIPGALPASSVISLYPSKKWKYIIIHHSATDQGNALAFYNSHKLRGFTYGLGYHFVIDNGSSGKPDGYIEVSPRWLKQQNGAHCKAAGMNYKAIGICLVGNYSQDEVSSKQLSSLAYLVNILRNYYDIPLRNIIGHGQVQGAETECPGRRFPWSRFFNQLKASGN